MAEAYGKLTGKPGIAFVTRGPGACHASIGVHISKQDSTPMILFIGQVESSSYGKESFQEIDYVSMFSKVAKWSHQISNADEIEEIVHKAFEVSNTGRKGPVVISLPEDMLSKKTSPKNLKVYKIKKPKLIKNKIVELKSLLDRSIKPIMILGGGNWTIDSRLGIEKFSLQNHLNKIRNDITKRSLGNSKQEMLNFRKELIERMNSDEAALTVTQWGDFFTTSMFRDLCFHEHEVQYDCQDLEKLIDEGTKGMPSGHAQLVGSELLLSLLSNTNFTTKTFMVIQSALTLYQRWAYKKHTVMQLIIGFLIGSLYSVIFWSMINGF